MNGTDTPDTDALMSDVEYQSVAQLQPVIDLTDHARCLERRLQEAHDMCDSYCEQLRAAEAELARLRDPAAQHVLWRAVMGDKLMGDKLMGDKLPEVKCEGEWLRWVAVERELPDSDITVMLFVPGSDEEVWPGYWDGESWSWAEGVPVEGEVVCWGHMPKGWG